ncbi:MAG: hypothetical protein HKO94_01470 [Flavobacteriaceae bacterium]|nr:hypothetical protein [Flavobacteriaceae bacterium]
MSNLFKSSEIRWFSSEKESLESIFRSLPGEFDNAQERTDYYLITALANTGIKIREGRHELKLKRDSDEFIESIGTIEHWAKWSSTEEQNILNTIEDIHLSDWLAVIKKRFLKIYSVSKNGKNVANAYGFVHDGCGVEFTILKIDDQMVYTLGLEAWGRYHKSGDNLIKVFRYLKLNPDFFKNTICMSYPEYLKNFINSE